MQSRIDKTSEIDPDDLFTGKKLDIASQSETTVDIDLTGNGARRGYMDVQESATGDAQRRIKDPFCRDTSGMHAMVDPFHHGKPGHGCQNADAFLSAGPPTGFHFRLEPGRDGLIG